MSNVYLQDTTLSAIGDAIRYKTGKSGLLLPSQMPAEIRSISGGGGGNIETDYVENLSSNFMITISDYFNGDLDKIVSFCGFRNITTSTSSYYDIPNIFFYHKGLNPIIKDQTVNRLSGTFDILICDEFVYNNYYYGYQKYLWQTSPATPGNAMLGLIYDSNDDQLKLVGYSGVAHWEVTSSSTSKGLAYLSQEV